MPNIFYLFSLIIFTFLLSACSSKSTYMKQDELQAKGEYKKAIEHATRHINTTDKTARDNLLWQLYLGQSQFFLEEDKDNNENAAISSFNEAENLMRHYREQILAKDIAREFGALLSNDTTRPYIGNEYDGIMLNTYKALAYLKKEDFSGARVEFNRAIDRQRRAKEFFSASIEKERKVQAEDKNRKQTSEQSENKQMQKTINTYYPELNSYRVYPDFINPMTNYLAALFAMANNDISKAEFLLKESISMLPNNTVIQDDYHKMMNADQQDDTVWLIYEEGQAPILEQLRIDFPAWIFTSQIDYVSIALPKMKNRTGAFSHLDIRDKDYLITQTQLLSSMQRVMHTEFKKHYPQIMKRAALSAISKAGLQKISKNSSNNIVNFATTVYTILSTQADTRIWSTLPKNFHIAKFKKNGRKSIDIYSNLNGTSRYKIASVKLSPSKHSLIYVKIPTLAHKVNVSSFSLGE